MNSIIQNSRAIVEAAIARGWCSAPVFTPPLSNHQIFRMRRNMNGLSVRNRPVVKIPKPRAPRRLGYFFSKNGGRAALEADFLNAAKSVTDFDAQDFSLWLERAGRPCNIYSVLNWISSMKKRGLIVVTRKTYTGGRPQPHYRVAQGGAR